MANGQGQKLRWWQDEGGQNQVAQKAVERVTAAPLPLRPETALSHNTKAERSESENDTWTELEAEALRRSQHATTREAESVSFFMNMPAVHAQRHREFRFFRGLYLFQAIVFLGLLGVLAYMALSLHKPDYFHFVFCLVGSIFGFWKWRSVPKPDPWFLAKETPSIRLESKGIFIDSLLYKDRFVPWSAVIQVTIGRRPNTRYLIILTVFKGRKLAYTFEERHLMVPVDAIAAQVVAYHTDINRKSSAVLTD